MKFQPGIKSQIFHLRFFHRHFFLPRMKTWYNARANSLFIFKKRWQLHKHVSDWPMTNLSILNVYKNLKILWNSEIATQTLTKSNYMKVGEKVCIDSKKSKKSKGFWFTLLSLTFFVLSLVFEFFCFFEAIVFQPWLKFFI